MLLLLEQADAKDWKYTAIGHKLLILTLSGEQMKQFTSKKVYSAFNYFLQNVFSAFHYPDIAVYITLIFYQIFACISRFVNFEWWDYPRFIFPYCCFLVLFLAACLPVYLLHFSCLSCHMQNKTITWLRLNFSDT